MIYFFDNCISFRLADMLRALGEPTEALREKYPEDIDDCTLFLELGKRRDVVFISTDTSQRNREAEARALKQTGMTALYLGPFFQKLGGWDKAVWLVKTWPKIKGFAQGVARGTCAEIKHNGRALPYAP